MTKKFIGISLLYIIAWCISPPLGYGTVYRLLALLLIGGLILLYFPKHAKCTMEQFAIICLIIYILVLTYVTGDAFTQRLGTLIMLALAFLASCIAPKYFDKNDASWIVFVTLVLCIIWNVCTLQAIQAVPNIMRLLAKNTDFAPAYAARGVGGYGYMYTVLLLLPIGIEWTLNKRERKLSRIVSAAFVVSSYVLVFRSQYFMAMLISLLVPVLFLICSIKNVRKRMCFLLIALIAFIMLLANIELVLNVLSVLAGDARSISIKLQDVYDIMNGGSIQESEFATRLARYKLALRTTLANPIFGALTYAQTGNHSTMLDIFAQYGLIVGTVLINVLFISPFRVGFRNTAAGSVTFTTMLLLAVLNVVPFAMGSILFIILPIYQKRTRVDRL